jgi:trans-aconitate 2-methyltransferase
MSWSPSQYVKFEEERNRPIRDLLARIAGGPAARAVDVGCGPGNSTELLRRHFPDADIVGIDSSPDMIEAARKRLPGVRFEIEDIAAWRSSGPFDVILANASLQWVPDHAALLPALVARLAPGGRLAVQIPDNLDEPAHVLMRETAAAGPWASKLADASRAREVRRGADWYYRALRDAGARADVWLTVYHHPLRGGCGDIVEFFKSTGLRPFLQPLGEGERADFLARYRAALAGAYPEMPDGTVLLPFPRLFFVAIR